MEQTILITPADAAASGVLPKELSFAIAYVPFQAQPATYSSEEGFAKGTLFPELYKPFTGGEVTAQ